MHFWLLLRVPSGSGVSLEDADLILRVVNGAIRTGGPLEATGIAGKVSLWRNVSVSGFLLAEACL